MARPWPCRGLRAGQGREPEDEALRREHVTLGCPPASTRDGASAARRCPPARRRDAEAATPRTPNATATSGGSNAMGGTADLRRLPSTREGPQRQAHLTAARRRRGAAGPSRESSNPLFRENTPTPTERKASWTLPGGTLACGSRRYSLASFRSTTTPPTTLLLLQVLSLSLSPLCPRSRQGRSSPADG